jgi:hypothetical protein
MHACMTEGTPSFTEGQEACAALGGQINVDIIAVRRLGLHTLSGATFSFCEPALWDEPAHGPRVLLSKGRR